MIVIVDYRMGNVSSIRNMLLRAGSDAVISADKKTIEQASKIILPGVGAFDAGMKNIADSGLRSILDQRALVDRVPVLGICLGMQLLGESSEEGVLPGLGWVRARTVRFCQPQDPQANPLRIPHMGWNTVEMARPGRLFTAGGPQPRFYFVHSYHVVCERAEDVVAITHYGGNVVASLECGNIFGVQFHPEKSHRFGMEVLKKFAELVP